MDKQTGVDLMKVNLEGWMISFGIIILLTFAVIGIFAVIDEIKPDSREVQELRKMNCNELGEEAWDALMNADRTRYIKVLQMTEEKDC